MNPATQNFHSETFVGDVRSDLTISATVNSYLPVALEPFNPMSDREDRVDAAIALFLQAADEGRPIGVSEFLQQHADLADELREFLQDQAAFRSVTSGLRQTLSGLAVPSKNSDLAWRPEDELPRVFGNFELQRIIGRGGMGTVYAARCNVVGESFPVIIRLVS